MTFGDIVCSSCACHRLLLALWLALAFLLLACQAMTLPSQLQRPTAEPAPRGAGQSHRRRTGQHGATQVPPCSHQHRHAAHSHDDSRCLFKESLPSPMLPVLSGSASSFPQDMSLQSFLWDCGHVDPKALAVAEGSFHLP